MKSTLYRLHGLTLASDLTLPELPPALPDALPDVEVRIGATPDSLGPGAASGPGWMAGPGRFLLNVPETGRYMVSEGRDILIQPVAGVEERDLRAYLLGPVMAALLHQRGLLVLHAGAVEVNGRAVAFAGRSGAGKSTLSIHLRQRGYRIITDDLLPIRLDAQGRPWTQPGFARIKLWRDSLEAIAQDPTQLTPCHSRRDKFLLPVWDDLRDAPLPLGRLIILNLAQSGEAIRLEPLPILEGMHVLSRVTYRPQLPKAMGLTADHFHLCSRVAGQTPIQRLFRPKQLDLMGRVLDLLEASWSGEDR